MGRWDLPEAEQRYLIDLRRHFHAHPELSWEEHQTAARVAAELKSLGYQVQEEVAGTGVMGDLGESGPTVILRADMDALPIDEQTGLPYASRNPGVMHACGHDAHTATLLTVARRLRNNPPTHGRVRLLFQPAEEKGEGAPAMIAAGALEVEELCGVYGLHYWSQRPTGVIGATAGAVMGSVDHLQITVRGRGGHGAEPQTANDALVAAAYLVTNLQTVVSRRLDPFSPVVVTIGEFHAGTAFNIIAEEAHLTGTVRTLDVEAWEAIPTLLEEVTQHCVAAMGCTASLRLKRVIRPLINHPESVALVREVAANFVPTENIQDFRTLGGEDFAAYLEHTKGCFFFLGAAGTGDPTDCAPHHNSRFILDEDAFSLGVQLLEACARKALEVGT